MQLADTIELLGKIIDLAGVAVIVVGASIATAVFLKTWIVNQEIQDAYVVYRQGLGRVILLGLEFLVAGDIVRSVAVSPGFRTVGVLALIVAIRSFLSIELEMEIEGRWPWQRGRRRTGENPKI